MSNTGESRGSDSQDVSSEPDSNSESAFLSASSDTTDSGIASIRRTTDWDGVKLRRLAADHQTPLYVIDLDRVADNCRRIETAFPAADLRYAVKAHTGQAVLKMVYEAGFDAECASAGELDRALAAGFPGERLHYTAVNPPARDLRYVVDAWRDQPELTVTVGAIDTLDRLADLGFDGRVCVRVNPGIGAGHHEKVRTGGHPKFGVPYDRAAEVIRTAGKRFGVVGIHAHAGSGIDAEQLDRHREFVSRMGDLARQLADPDAGTPVDLEYVDVGGGFGVPYRAEQPPLDLAAVAAATRDAVGELPRSTGGSATLAIEPGRFVVADAGVLLTRVNTVKETADGTVAGVDAGMTDLLRPAMYDAHHPIRNLGHDADPSPLTDSRAETSVTVAGPICESADVFCENRQLPTPTRGDVLTVGIAGAYGFEMASQYNSRPRPAEVALQDDTSRITRRRESLVDLTQTEHSR